MSESSSSNYRSSTSRTTTSTIQGSMWSPSYYLNLWNRSFSEPDAVDETSKTLLRLTEKYGDTHPTFKTGSYNEALSHAKSNFKFLLVYVHSQAHPDAQSFCKDVLFTKDFKEYIDTSFVFWVCDVSTSIGLRMSNQLGATTYPFLSMIQPIVIPGNQNLHHEIFQGTSLLSKSNVMTKINEVTSIYEPLLISARADHELREQDRFIRQEQDEAFLQSLREDQEKERIKREKEEQERLEQEQLEKEEQDRLEFERQLIERKERKQKLYIDEPTKSATTTKLVFRLNDGSKVQRNFLESETIEYVMDYLDTLIPDPIENYILSTHYPKKQYHNLNNTLKEEGLVPDAVLFLSEK
ncbi:hypothetical protein CYY_001285 [Polysphondylium violaceum]|uniref:UBX domain-containing protein n=1 Tax=Polysphondylium violaceum TaxID=133409 RepID=A0A8J4Q0D9_9MYCE|nr:hypothetical protein CYY_001285 [Polysphondylium violaceum]